MLRDIPDDMPAWASDLVQDLGSLSARGDCEHERWAYSDAAHMVIDYWENADG